MQIYQLLFLPTAAYALVDCFHGFVGRMQASIEDNYFHINDTSMCSAMYCIKVIVHSAMDDEAIFQQGISSRCAYTGGDRQACTKADGKCQDISFYDGMRGNFSFCCCKEDRCNSAPSSDLENIYQSNVRTAKKSPNSSDVPNFLISILFTFCLLFY